MQRLFVAIGLPNETIDALVGLEGNIRDARWLRREALHLTLAFIGNVHAFEEERVDEALRAVHGDPLILQVKGVGHFPPRGRPRVLWAGIAATDGLQQLQEHVVRSLRAAGFRIEKRRFHPHVTLARLKGPSAGRVADFLQAHSLFDSEPFEVDAFHLYSSQLRPDGARHAVEMSYPLDGSD